MCAFKGRVESDIDSLSNQDSENLPMNNVFSELPCEEELEYEEVAQNSTAHGPAAMRFGLNKKEKRKYASWDERFKELVDFKAINDHTIVPRGSGPLWSWVKHQREAFRRLKEGKCSTLTSDKCGKLESIGFECRLTGPPWDQRFQELVDFKKINGHTNVSQGSGPLGGWVNHQREAFRRLKEVEHSPSTNDKREKLESIGFVFKCRPTGLPWDQRFQELVDFKKINGHANVPQKFGQLGNWVNNQRTQYRRYKEGKHSPLTNDKRDKLESIGFQFKCRPTGPPWDQRFQELVDFKKINGHTNVPTNYGPLKRWIDNQRLSFCQLEEGKHSTLTNERRDKLDSIGFRFNIHKIS
eukprot:scaffold108921_cov41-Attheya_sp.AAC.1